MSDQCFVLFTRSIGNHNRRYLSGLAQDLAGAADLVVLSYDAQSATAGSDVRVSNLSGVRHITVTRSHLAATFEDYPQKYRDDDGWGIMPGNLDLAQLACTRIAKGYEHYWFCEDDVRYSGSFADLIAECDASDAALLATNIRPVPERWPHLPDLPERLVCALEAEEIPICFLPFFRVRKHFLDTLDSAYREGLYGHHEATWPFVAAGVDGGLADFRQVRSDLYTGAMKNGRLSDGSFVYRPPKLPWGMRANTLYHPVKPLHQFIKSWLSSLRHRLSRGG